MSIAIVNTKPKTDYQITHFGNQEIAQRMLSMGVLPGASIRVIRKAPLGGNLYLKINQTLNLAVRPTEAANIFVK